MRKFRFNPWHWGLAAVFFVLLSGMWNPASGPEEGIVLVVLSYLLGRVAFWPVKKYFFRKAVLFDMGGVVTQGDFYTEQLTEMPGTRDLIERLKVHYKVAMLTNNNALGFKPFDRKFGFSQLFDQVIVSGEEGVKKPEEKFYKIALHKLRVKAENTYFLDDTPANIEAAKKLGIHGFVFKDAKTAEADLKKAGLRF